MKLYNSANIHCRYVNMFLQIEERMSSAQELSEGWREIKEQKQDLTSLFQDMEQQLLSFSRRPAELETKIAQNMLSQAKVGNHGNWSFDKAHKGELFFCMFIKINIYCMSTCAFTLTVQCSESKHDSVGDFVII